MPWGRLDDRLAMSAKVRGLHDDGAVGPRAKRQRAESLGVWVQVLSWVTGERSDGFVTEDVLDLFGWPGANARLLRAKYGRAPLLHRRPDGEACECMTGRSWPDGFDYLIHDYLDRNPSRSESDVHRAKGRELKDPALKQAVRDRDRDVCRYCAKVCRHSDRKSDDGLTFDHVDPEIADGINNLVVACRGCNRAKGRRTPEQAGLTLNPAPGARGPTLGSAPGSTPDLRPITDPTTDRITDPDSDPDPDSGADPRPEPRADAGVWPLTNAATTGPTCSPGSPGTGRGGPGQAADSGPRPPSTRIGPPDTFRGPLNPAPYRRTPRPAPEHHAGHPPAGPAPPPAADVDPPDRTDQQRGQL